MLFRSRFACPRWRIALASCSPQCELMVLDARRKGRTSALETRSSCIPATYFCPAPLSDLSESAFRLTVSGPLNPNRPFARAPQPVDVDAMDALDGEGVGRGGWRRS